MVCDLAASAGAQIQFGITVTQISPSVSRPSVTLSSGEVVEADIIIGADGRDSVVRKIVAAELEEERPLPSGMSVYASTISAELLKDDPELESFVTPDQVRFSDPRYFSYPLLTCTSGW